MSVNEQDFIYCPVCAKTLEVITEEEKSIKFCHGCQETYYPKHAIAVAGIAIKFNPSAQILMVLRKKEPSANKWSFPAGYVNYGEHPDDALIREVHEETGLTVIRFKLTKEVVSDDDPRSPKQQSKFYKMVVVGKVKIKDTEEISTIDWWSLNQNAPIPKIAWENHERLFNELRKDVAMSLSSFHTNWVFQVR